MKMNNFFADQIYLELNECISTSQFTAGFTYANVTPVSKKPLEIIRIKYRPISTLPVVSKDFEKLM